MSHGENPYGAPSDPPAAGYGVPAPVPMDYTGSYGYVFQSEAWLPNIFFAAISQLIPVIGPIIMLGYQFEIVESLIRDPRRRYPDFDWGKFVQYLTRGIWPFLVSLIVGLVAAPVIWIVTVGVMLLIGAASGGGNEAATALGAFALFGFFVMFLLAVLALQLVISAFQIRAGLSQDFAASFNFGWARDFVVRMWLELLLSMVFLTLTGWVLAMGGLLLLCVGIYLAISWVMLAQAHLYFQLYRLYLARGGMAIPLKPLPPPAPGMPV